MVTVISPNAVDRGWRGFYLSAAEGGGEPPGFLGGQGTAALGLVDAQVMRDLYHHGIGPGSPGWF